MTELKNFNNIKLDTALLKDLKPIDPMNNLVNQMQYEQRKILDSIHQSRKEKEQEALNRHTELIAAVKKAGESGATISIGDNANGIQIQQNAQNANQIMTNFQEFNYSQALNVLNEIKEYFDMPKFSITFQDKADIVKQIVSETIDAIERNEDVSLIQKSLRILKDLAVGTGGSLIATGIIGLLNTLLI